jgi:AcrR family transcriptional regulator
VDVALIHHYFQSKEELFLATMQIPVRIHELVAPLVAEGTDGLGERLVRTMLAIWESDLQASLVASLAQRSPSQQTPVPCRNSWQSR